MIDTTPSETKLVDDQSEEFKTTNPFKTEVRFQSSGKSDMATREVTQSLFNIKQDGSSDAKADQQWQKENRQTEESKVAQQTDKTLKRQVSQQEEHESQLKKRKLLPEAQEVMSLKKPIKAQQVHRL